MSFTGIDHKAHCPAKLVSPTFPWKTTLKSSGCMAIASTIGGIAITIIFFTAPSILGPIGAFALIGPAATGGISSLILIVIGGVKTACKQRCIKRDTDTDTRDPTTTEDVSEEEQRTDSERITTSSDDSSDSFYTADGSDAVGFHTPINALSENEESEEDFELDLDAILQGFAKALIQLHADVTSATTKDITLNSDITQAITTLCSINWNWEGIDFSDVEKLKTWLAAFLPNTEFSEIAESDLDAKDKCHAELVNTWDGIIDLIRYGLARMRDGQAIIDLDAQIEAKLLEDTKDMYRFTKALLNNSAALTARKNVVKIAVSKVLADPKAAQYAKQSAQKLFIDNHYKNHTSLNLKALTNISYQRLMDDIIYDSKEIKYLFQMINAMAPANKRIECQNALLNLIEGLYPVYYNLALSDTPDFSKTLAKQFDKLPEALEKIDPAGIDWFSSLLERAIDGDYAASLDSESEEEFSD